MNPMADVPAQPDLSMEEILAVIRRNIAEDARPPGLRALPTPDTVEILELTDAIEDDGTVRRIGNRPASPPRRLGEPPPRLGRASAYRDSRDQAFRDGRDASPPPRARLDREATIAAGSHSIEDLVAELLRPLLREWLDA